MLFFLFVSIVVDCFALLSFICFFVFFLFFLGRGGVFLFVCLWFFFLLFVLFVLLDLFEEI